MTGDDGAPAERSVDGVLATRRLSALKAAQWITNTP
jgi:hypothetical protein